MPGGDEREAAARILKPAPGFGVRRQMRFQVAPRSNPTLPPNLVILKLTPGNDLRGLEKHRFDFNQLNWIGGQLRLYNLAHQKMFLFGHGLHRRPFG